MIESSTISHVGNVRDLNEDNFMANGEYLEKIRNYYNKTENNENDKNLFIVADGMGGTPSGEVASHLIVKEFSELYDNIITLKCSSLNLVKGFIKNKVNEINKKAFEINEKMGSTLTGVFINENEFFTFNLGDSSVFLIRDEVLVKLTVNHTWARKLYDQKQITFDEYENYDKQNKLLRYIGINPEYGDIYPTFSENYKLKENDLILVCSDGLTDMVDKQNIELLLSSKKRVDELNTELLELVLKNGGIDNITSILIRKKFMR